MQLETARLILRPWREDDAEILYKYASDPQVGPAAGWPAHKSVEESRSVIINVLSAPETYALVLKETGLPVGSIGIKRDSLVKDPTTEAELGYWIGRDYWGQGLVPEAAELCLRRCFETLGCEKVWCGYYEGNEKSRRVQEKCGFRYYGRNENTLCPLLGEVRTEIVNLITRGDWEERHGGVSEE